MARTLIALLVCVTLLFALTACAGGEESGEHNEGAETGELNENSETGENSEQSESEEHSRNGEGGEHSEESDSDGDGEESGTQYGLTETYDVVRAGARLILSYDASSNAFMGTVENTTEDTLRRVRVEVHLSNGIELGPTTPLDLAPGQVTDITLPATTEPFESWSAHPEVG